MVLDVLAVRVLLRVLLARVEEHVLCKVREAGQVVRVRHAADLHLQSRRALTGEHAVGLELARNGDLAVTWHEQIDTRRTGATHVHGGCCLVGTCIGHQQRLQSIGKTEGAVGPVIDSRLHNRVPLLNRHVRCNAAGEGWQQQAKRHQPGLGRDA